MIGCAARRVVTAPTRNNAASCRVSVHQVRNFTAYMCCLGRHPQAHLRWIVRVPLHFADSGLEGQRNVATTGELMSAISPMLPRSDSSPSP